MSLVGGVVGGFGLVPPNSQAKIVEQGIQWNYTTWLNIIALLLTAVLLVRFFRTGGREMMAMMNGGPDDMEHHDHGSSDDHEKHDHGAHHQGRHGA